MKKALVQINLELWANSSDFVNHGIPWWLKVVWFFLNRPFYDKIIGLSRSNQLFVRGFYDRFHNRTVLCVNDLMISTLESLQQAKLKGYITGNVHGYFALQFYYTLVHEMLHQMNVAKDDGAGGHKIDFEKFEKLPESLKDMFDGLLELENSNDAFNNHPDNRRDDNGKDEG